MNQKSSLQNSLFPRFSLKAISLFTVIVFLCSDFLSFPSQALADQRPQTTDQSLGLQSPVSSLRSGFAIPPELGSIAEQYGVKSSEFGEKAAQPTPNSTLPTVFLIEDAHSIPDAQRSLEKLIEYLQKNYGVTTVALEGAEGKLDPALFRLFPDAKKRESIFADYLASGELSGAAAASVLSPGKAEYIGIEDWKLYQDGVAAFLSGLEQQPVVNAQRATLNEDLQKMKAKYYSKEALEFDRKLGEWQEEPGKLAELLAFLSKYDVPNAKYLALGALFASLEQEKKRDPKLEIEVKKLAQIVHKIAPSSKLNSLVQDYRTGRIGQGEFAYGLSTLIRDPVSDQRPGLWRGGNSVSAEMQALIANHEKLVSLKGPAFIKELEQFIADVKMKLLVTGEAKAVAELDERMRLFGKLTKFELSRDEWKEFRDSLQTAGGQAGLGPNTNQSQRSRDWGRPNYHFEKEVKSLDGTRDSFQNIKNKIETLGKQAGDFQNFYQIAEEREAVFLKRLYVLLKKNESRGASDKSRATNAVAFVAGGFHTSGLAAKLKEQGIPYVVVSPAMKEVPKDNRYFDHMQGKVSWQKYFRPRDGKIDLYDAFARATTERLLSAASGQRSAVRQTLNAERYTLNAKEWRDSIIRELAASGRIAEHSKYTRYIDQQVAGNSEEFQKLKEKWTAKLEKFIQGLRFLHGKNQLTEANVAKLLSQPAAVAWTAIPLHPMSVPAEWNSSEGGVRSSEKKQAFAPNSNLWTHDSTAAVPSAVEIPPAAQLTQDARPNIEGRAKPEVASRPEARMSSKERFEQFARKWPALLTVAVSVYFLITSALSTVLLKKVLTVDHAHPLGYILSLFIFSNVIGFTVLMFQNGPSAKKATFFEKLGKLRHQWNLTDEEHRVYNHEMTRKDRLLLFFNALQGQTIGTILFITAMATALPAELHALFFTTRSVIALVMGHWVLGYLVNMASERVPWRKYALGLTLVFGGLLSGMTLTGSASQAASVGLGVTVTAFQIVLAAAQLILQRYLLKKRFGHRPELQPALRMIMVKYGYLQGLAFCSALFVSLGLFASLGILPPLLKVPGQIAGGLFSHGAFGFFQQNIWIPILSLIYFANWHITYYLQSHARLVTAVLVPSLTPVTTWAIASMLFGQSLTLGQIAFGAVATLGLIKVGLDNLSLEKGEKSAVRPGAPTPSRTEMRCK